MARFGSPRRLARGLSGCRRVPRVARVALAAGALGLSGSFAYTQLRGAAPVVAVSLGSDSRYAATSGTVTVVGHSRFVSLDPDKLRVVHRGPVILTGHAEGFDWLPPDLGLVSPDGSRVAVISDAALHFYDLQKLRLLGSTRLGTRPQSGPTRPNQRAGEADALRSPVAKRRSVTNGDRLDRFLIVRLGVA